MPVISVNEVGRRNKIHLPSLSLVYSSRVMLRGTQMFLSFPFSCTLLMLQLASRGWIIFWGGGFQYFANVRSTERNVNVFYSILTFTVYIYSMHIQSIVIINYRSLKCVLSRYYKWDNISRYLPLTKGSVGNPPHGSSREPGWPKERAPTISFGWLPPLWEPEELKVRACTVSSSCPIPTWGSPGGIVPPSWGCILATLSPPLYGHKRDWLGEITKTAAWIFSWPPWSELVTPTLVPLQEKMKSRVERPSVWSWPFL